MIKLKFLLLCISFNFLIITQNYLSFDKKITGHNNKINAIAFSKDNRFLITGSWDGTIIVRDLISDQILHKLGGNKPGETHFITDIDISNDNNYFVSSSSDFTATIWEIKTGKIKKILKGHKDFVMSAAYSDDDSFILTTSFDYNAMIWSKDGDIKHILKHPDNVKFGIIGKNYILTGSNNIAYLWTKTGILKNQFIFNQTITNLKFSPNNDYVIVGYENGNIVVWETHSGKALYTIKPHESSIFSIATSMDNKFIITGSTDLYSCKIDLTKGEIVHKNFDGIWVFCSHIDKHSKYYITGGNHINLRNYQTGELLQKIETKSFVTNIMTFKEYLVVIEKDVLKLYKFLT